jgi:glycosyltransferase involved in cell wall biosynthesis
MSAQIPKVSIIIPTYRHRDFILRTLDSVFAQTMQDYEIIVINDGSPDDTKTVLAPLIESKRIRYFDQENQGQSTARNRGLELAYGQYIAFLDDDDLWPEDKLEWQCHFLDKNPDVAVIGGVFQAIDAQGNLGWRRHSEPAITFESFFADNPFASPGQTLIRADVLKQIGGMNASIWGADDWDLWFRIVRQHKIVMEDRVALYYRLHSANASKQAGRLLKGACQTLNIHLKYAKPANQQRLRRTAHRWLYGLLGTPLVVAAKRQIREHKFSPALRSFADLKPLGWSLVFDAPLRRQFLREILGGLKRKLIGNPVKK